MRWVDAGKGIAIALVVLFHAARWLDGLPADTAAWQQVNDTLATMRLPLFFTLAGLFAAKWATAPVADLWNTKLRLFAWVFVLWAVIDLGPYWLGQGLHGTGINFRREIFDTLMAPVVPRFELWFIWALALFFLLNRVTRRLPASIVLIASFAVSVVGFTGLLPLPSPGWTGLCKYYFFFFGGMVLRAALFRYAAHSGWLLRGGVFFVWAAGAVAVTHWGLTTVPGIMPALGVLGVLAGVAASQALQHVSVVVSLGAKTLPVYLAHTPTIIVLSAVGVIAPPAPLLEAAAIVYPPLVAIAAIMLSLALYRVSRRGALRWLFEPPPRLLLAKRPESAQRSV
ncbi:acyltransferase family protein [Microbacterium sp. zg.Y1084]|uniref:acyltransferase family protein n=1 Tax=Microbacterium sp. zg.Y1084 TaxID=2969667 RepID=UPI00214CC21E|nr:acyltransferase family protein [Microbacterium sp. zg.Y1084]MCR2814122.1 acyltransferase family protein [Microbacterium sp. zg.Y1084]